MVCKKLLDLSIFQCPFCLVNKGILKFSTKKLYFLVMGVSIPLDSKNSRPYLMAPPFCWSFRLSTLDNGGKCIGSVSPHLLLFLTSFIKLDKLSQLNPLGHRLILNIVFELSTTN